jgi:beta-glucanase (GH16 family)
MADWKLEHEEDFASASALDANFWAVETGFHRNRENQYYTPGNLRVADGFLRIEARREQVPNAEHRPGARAWRQMPRVSQYTSGSIVSKRDFQYGRVEVVARSPAGAGVWPAIWLLHESAGQYGEIDIFEYVGKHPQTAFAGVHYGRDPRTRKHQSAHRIVPGFEGAWRVHTVEWTPQRIVVSLDGKPLLAFDPAQAAVRGSDPLRLPMRLRINLALGGSWGGPIDDSKLPAHFDIASVRVWRWEPGAGAAAAPVLPAAAAPASEPAAVRGPAPAADAPAASPAPADPPPPADAPVRIPRWGR